MRAGHACCCLDCGERLRLCSSRRAGDCSRVAQVGPKVFELGEWYWTAASVTFWQL
jgi:hypothetical protein